MKKAPLALALVLFSVPAFSQSGPSASGGFRFDTPQGAQNVEFSARTSPGGSVAGEVKFRGPAEVPVEDVDGDGSLNGGTFAAWQIRADIDCLQVRDNRASMSGLITEATQGSLVGRRMIFTVEDNGEGNGREPDRFTWGLYRNDVRGWTPSDAELEFDDGASRTWNATDAEREDDVPVPARQSLNSDCRSFPLSSYVLEDIGRGAGNIQVRP